MLIIKNVTLGKVTKYEEGDEFFRFIWLMQDIVKQDSEFVGDIHDLTLSCNTPMTVGCFLIIFYGYFELPDGRKFNQTVYDVIDTFDYNSLNKLFQPHECPNSEHYINKILQFKGENHV